MEEIPPLRMEALVAVAFKVYRMKMGIIVIPQVPAYCIHQSQLVLNQIGTHNGFRQRIQ